MTPQELRSSLTEWQSITQWLATAKEKEMSLRVQLAKYLFANKLEANGELPEGTSKGKFAAGDLHFKAKVVGKLNRTVLEELRAAAVEEAKLSAEEAKNIFKLKAELSLTQYKALNEEQRKIIDRAIVVKPAAPTLEIEMVTE